VLDRTFRACMSADGTKRLSAEGSFWIAATVTGVMSPKHEVGARIQKRTAAVLARRNGRYAARYLFMGGKQKVAAGSSGMPVCCVRALDAGVPALGDRTPMPLVEPLAPEGHQRIPWRNGRGELIVIDREGGESWQDLSVAWHFGRTAIIEEGPFSDYTGHERLQVVTKGAGLVLIAPDHEIDLRLPMHPRRYDGGTPIRTLLEKGPVEVVNLIADRARFDIDLRVGKAGANVSCRSGRHVVYAPVGPAHVEIDECAYTLAEDHALRLRVDAGIDVSVQAGQVIVGSVHDKS